MPAPSSQNSNAQSTRGQGPSRRAARSAASAGAKKASAGRSAKKALPSSQARKALPARQVKKALPGGKARKALAATTARKAPLSSKAKGASADKRAQVTPASQAASTTGVPSFLTTPSPAEQGKAAAASKAAAAAKQAASAPAPAASAASAPKTAAASAPKASGTKAKPSLAGALAWVKQNRRSPKVIVPVVLLILYVLGTLLFSTRYLPGTAINGEDVSWKTPTDVAALMQGKAKDYQLQVEGDGVELSLAGTRMNLSYDNDAFVAGAEARIPSWKWVAALLQDRSYNVSNGIAFNEGRVSRAVYAAVTEANKGTVVPKNATLDYDDKAASFVVVDEQPGTAVNEEATFERTSGALKTLRTRVKLTEADLEQPTLLASDSRMAQAIEQANKLNGLSFDLTVDGNVVKSLDPSLVRSWVSLDTSCQVTGDLDMVTQWAVGSLSSEFDSVGSTRAYTRPDDGKYIEVSGGTYGWNVDGAALAQLICEQIAAGSSDPIEIPFKSRAAVFSPGGADWGTRYLDVDLSEQYVRFFDEYGNLVWESECVSGDVGLGNDTVTGVFILYSKESPKKLIGLDYDGDGEPDYENDVTFWMPFYGGYGLHDAEWRSYFGPDAYTYYGSHGCINLPYDAAEQLFYTIEIDDPVVVHY